MAHGRDAGVTAVGARECERARRCGGHLVHDSRTGDVAGQHLVVRRCVREHCPAVDVDGAGVRRRGGRCTECACQRDRARRVGDGRIARVGVGTAQHERARPRLGEVGIGRTGNHSGIREGDTRRHADGAIARLQRDAALGVNRHARRHGKRATVELEMVGRYCAGHRAEIAISGDRQGAANDGGARRVRVGARECERSRASLCEATGASSHAAVGDRRPAISRDGACRRKCDAAIRRHGERRRRAQRATVECEPVSDERARRSAKVIVSRDGNCSGRNRGGAGIGVCSRERERARGGGVFGECSRARDCARERLGCRRRICEGAAVDDVAGVSGGARGDRAK